MKNSPAAAVANPVFRPLCAHFRRLAPHSRRITGLMCCLFATLGLTAIAQQPMEAPHDSVQLLTSGTSTSLRGLSVVTDEIVWVSGSKGTVGKSLDGGKTWTWFTVPGYEKRDFRDIEAFDSKTAIIIAIAE